MSSKGKILENKISSEEKLAGITNANAVVDAQYTVIPEIGRDITPRILNAITAVINAVDDKSKELFEKDELVAESAETAELSLALDAAKEVVTESKTAVENAARARAAARAARADADELRVRNEIYDNAIADEEQAEADVSRIDIQLKRAINDIRFISGKPIEQKQFTKNALDLLNYIQSQISSIERLNKIDPVNSIRDAYIVGNISKFLEELSSMFRRVRSTHNTAIFPRKSAGSLYSSAVTLYTRSITLLKVLKRQITLGARKGLATVRSAAEKIRDDETARVERETANIAAARAREQNERQRRDRQGTILLRRQMMAEQQREDRRDAAAAEALREQRRAEYEVALAAARAPVARADPDYEARIRRGLAAVRAAGAAARAAGDRWTEEDTLRVMTETRGGKRTRSKKPSRKSRKSKTRSRK